MPMPLVSLLAKSPYGPFSRSIGWVSTTKYMYIQCLKKDVASSVKIETKIVVL